MIFFFLFVLLHAVTWQNALNEGLYHCAMLSILPLWSIQITVRPGRQGQMLFSWARSINFYLRDCQVIQPEASGLFWCQKLLEASVSSCNKKTAKERNKTFHRGNANLIFLQLSKLHFNLETLFFQKESHFKLLHSLLRGKCCPAFLHSFFWQLKEFWNAQIAVKNLTGTTSEFLLFISWIVFSRHKKG